jgi:hypothetical protein
MVLEPNPHKEEDPAKTAVGLALAIKPTTLDVVVPQVPEPVKITR